ncbi:flavin reductase family protein [Streptomyces asiaticus]
MPAATTEQPVATPADAAFLDAMSALAGGVCVITTIAPDGRPAGFTSTAVMSLSRTPQLLAIGVGQRSRTLPVLLDAGRFVLNVLHGGGENISRRFADSTADRFADLDWDMGESGVPLLTAHTSHMVVCGVQQAVPAGDHQLIIAAVESVLPGAEGAGSLVYQGRGYHVLGRAGFGGAA